MYWIALKCVNFYQCFLAIEDYAYAGFLHYNPLPSMSIPFINECNHNNRYELRMHPLTLNAMSIVIGGRTIWHPRRRKQHVSDPSVVQFTPHRNAIGRNFI